MNMNVLFEKYIKNNGIFKKVNNYYIEKLFWNNFFYENIKHIPYITYIGIFWSIENNKKWDSNEGARGYIKTYFSYAKNDLVKISNSNGFPIYQLFNYLKFLTPSKIKKNSILIKDVIGKEYYNFFNIILKDINSTILSHKEYLNKNNVYSKNKFFDKWTTCYQWIINNENEVKILLNNINKIIGL